MVLSASEQSIPLRVLYVSRQARWELGTHKMNLAPFDFNFALALRD